VGSVVPEAHILAVIFEVPVFVHAVVPTMRLVVAVVPSTRVVA